MDDPFGKINERLATRAYGTAFLGIGLGAMVLSDGESNGVFIVAVGICAGILGRALERTARDE